MARTSLFAHRDGVRNGAFLCDFGTGSYRMTSSLGPNGRVPRSGTIGRRRFSNLAFCGVLFGGARHANLQYFGQLAVGLCSALVCLHLGVGSAQAKRVALVIGDATYREGSAHLKDSLAIATLIGSNLRSAGFAATLHHAEPIAGENRPLLNGKLGIYAAPFAVLRYADMPAVLFEVGIIANRAEEKELEDPMVRAEMQVQLLSALQEFCTRRSPAEED